MGTPVGGEQRMVVRVGMQSDYWLWVMEGRSLPPAVQAVGLDESAGPQARDSAGRLARDLGVLVETSSSPFPGLPQGSPRTPAAGPTFDQPANSRLKEPFKRGQRDGT